MSDEVNKAKEMAKEQDIHMSTVRKDIKSLRYLQRMKDKGEKIVQMCPAELGPMFGMAAEMAGCDIMRVTDMISDVSGLEAQVYCTPLTIKKYRTYCKIIHMNMYMPTPAYASKELAIKYGSDWTFQGADSMLPMAVTNEVLKAMSDNYVPTYGHIGAVSGWQTNATGYARLGKTAEDAFRIFKWGYEYQENGMGGMTIELTPAEVSQKISEKLRVPVLGIAGSAPCDGSEMVDMDTFGMMPSAAVHAKTYNYLMPFMVETYMAWADDVREGNYPAEEHCWHMDPAEAEKFYNLVDNF